MKVKCRGLDSNLGVMGNFLSRASQRVREKSCFSHPSPAFGWRRGRSQKARKMRSRCSPQMERRSKRGRIFEKTSQRQTNTISVSL